jgi:hypothetical protein
VDGMGEFLSCTKPILHPLDIPCFKWWRETYKMLLLLSLKAETPAPVARRLRPRVWDWTLVGRIIRPGRAKIGDSGFPRLETPGDEV